MKAHSPIARLIRPPGLQPVAIRSEPGGVPPDDPSGPADRRPARATRRRDWLWQARGRSVGLMHAVVRRFIADNCLSGASALSYASLVSLVPLAAIVLSVFSGFQVFEGARDRFLVVLLHMFAPEVGEEIAWSFQRLAGNAARTTTVGLVALAVTSVVLLVTIEEHLNIIWRIRTPRGWLQRILAYWAIITMGPLLVGAGISITSYIDQFARSAGAPFAAFDQSAREALAALSWIVPFVLETGAFLALFRLIPNCRVSWRDGVAGALVAAALLEALKLAMVIYVSEIAYYSRVYGALAGIPIFLLWLYVFWTAVLFGAEVAAHLADGEARGSGARSGLRRAACAAPAPAAAADTAQTFIESEDHDHGAR